MSKTKQLRTPCDDCAFLRTSTPGNLGGSRPEVYVGQCYGPFWIPCHSSRDYRCQDAIKDEEAECVGSAIFRANTGRAECMPDGLLHMEPNTELVFATNAEFMAHHLGCSVEVAQMKLDVVTPEMLFVLEMTKREVRDPTKPREQPDG